MRRLLAVLVGAGIAVGGGVAAWAGPLGPHREAAKACRAEARAADPDADRPALKEAVRACLEAQGITRPERDAHVRPKLAELRECREKVRADHPEAVRAELRRLVRECVRAG